MPADLKVLKPGKSKNELSEAEASEFFNLYVGINSTLRAWFIAAGVGGPAFILANAPIQEKLARQGNLRCTLVIFGIGIAAQVGIAVLNKHLNWLLYRDRELGGSKNHAFLEWLSEKYSLDFAADVVACAAIVIGYFTVVFRGA